MRKRKLWRHKLTELSRSGFSGYPIATVAYYGPDNVTATKVAVGIVLDDNQDSENIEMRKWMSGETDIRFNEKIHNEILQFIRSRNVKSVALTDQIIGCPHEEGLDYLSGESCPMCLFWKDRDRFTHKIIE